MTLQGLRNSKSNGNSTCNSNSRKFFSRLSLGIQVYKIQPRMENQMEKKMGNEMEAGVIKEARKGSKYTNNTCIGPSSLQLLPTLDNLDP